jgi:hypothetical protein
MKRIVLPFALVAVAQLFFFSQVSAQPGMMWRGGGGWGPGAPYARQFNPQSVETLAGEVVSLDHVTPMHGMSAGVHLALRTDKETIAVHLGPSWYIENQDVKIEPGDKVEVKGSRVTQSGSAVLIAAELKKGDEVLTLRDPSGFPAWSGWRRR